MPRLERGRENPAVGREFNAWPIGEDDIAGMLDARGTRPLDQRDARWLSFERLEDANGRRNRAERHASKRDTECPLGTRPKRDRRRRRHNDHRGHARNAMAAKTPPSAMRPPAVLRPCHASAMATAPGNTRIKRVET